MSLVTIPQKQHIVKPAKMLDFLPSKTAKNPLMIGGC